MAQKNPQKDPEEVRWVFSSVQSTAVISLLGPCHCHLSTPVHSHVLGEEVVTEEMTEETELVVQSRSCVQLSVTPLTAARQPSLSFTLS